MEINALPFSSSDDHPSISPIFVSSEDGAAAGPPQRGLRCSRTRVCKRTHVIFFPSERQRSSEGGAGHQRARRPSGGRKTASPVGKRRKPASDSAACRGAAQARERLRCLSGRRVQARSRPGGGVVLMRGQKQRSGRVKAAGRGGGRGGGVGVGGRSRKAGSAGAPESLWRARVPAPLPPGPGPRPPPRRAAVAAPPPPPPQGQGRRCQRRHASPHPPTPPSTECLPSKCGKLQPRSASRPRPRHEPGGMVLARNTPARHRRAAPSRRTVAPHRRAAPSRRTVAPRRRAEVL
jgi:hypothetical protein